MQEGRDCAGGAEGEAGWGEEDGEVGAATRREGGGGANFDRALRVSSRDCDDDEVRSLWEVVGEGEGEMARRRQVSEGRRPDLT